MENQPMSLRAEDEWIGLVLFFFGLASALIPLGIQELAPLKGVAAVFGLFFGGLSLIFSIRSRIGSNSGI